MTEQLQDIQVAITIFGDDDLVIEFEQLNEVAEDDYTPATISDEALIALVCNHQDIDESALIERVYGQGNTNGRLVVSRPETGHIVIRPETKLGK